MAYAADLITVLKSLFGQVTQLSPSEAPKVTREALNKVYQAHKMSDDRRKIYRCIGADFQQQRQIPGRDEEVFRHLLLRSLGIDSVSPRDLGAGPSPKPGAEPSNPGAGPSSNPGAEPSNPGAGPSPGPPGKPPQEEPVPPPRSNCLQVWSRRLICCSTPP